MKPSPKDGAVGFVYGFSYDPDGYTAGMLKSCLNRTERDYWLANCFEFVEPAVVPEARGAGAGRLLYDRILADQDHDTALLFTPEVDTPASKMYRRRGWQTLTSRLRFLDDGPSVRLMGLKVRKTL